MLGKLSVGACLAFLLLGVQSVRFDSPDQLLLFDHGDVNEVQPQSFDEEASRFGIMASAPPKHGSMIPQAERFSWRLKCSTTLKNHRCDRAKDGKNNTFWQTNVDANQAEHAPHTITIDLRKKKRVTAISMRPLPDADLAGAIAGHKIYVSMDGENWTLVAFGSWFEDPEDKYALIEPQDAKFVKLEATSATGGWPDIRVVDIRIWALPYLSPTPSGRLGKWGPTVNFPLVPVGVFIDPIGGKVISFSSYAHDMFGQTTTDHTTLTSTYDPTTLEISHRQVRNTEHDMFCPGMAFDVDGRMIISGGESADRVSIYQPKNDTWEHASEMIHARGYQGSVTLSDGSIFVIGGSWGPHGLPTGDRNGEVYDTVKNRWTLLKNAPSEPLTTTEDWEKDYRSDNHVWLVGWKNNSVFHPGPSKTMHWITTSGDGSIKEAGQRGPNDTMCGVSVLYDAVEGKILTAGGASSYNYRDGDGNVRGALATNRSYIITLGDVNQKVDVKPVSKGLTFGRSFGHAVVLPNGETVYIGGQAEPRVFTENNGTMTPEIYSPETDSWSLGMDNHVFRGYHSFALLLRDATVLVGGGGLSNQFDVNHFDAQIYIPEYLLDEKRERAPRPAILAPSQTAVLPGGNITILTDSDVVSASLVRYGGATHSLNNDQRRLPLKLHDLGSNQYTAAIPADGGVALPGYYMLFVMNSKGVPSEATNVQILVSHP